MRSSAQVGMEYLVNFGWALVLVLSIIGALLFLPSQPVSLSSSQPEKLVVEESILSGELLAMRLQNPGSEKLELVGIGLAGSFDQATCSVEGTGLSPLEPFSVEIGPGGEIILECEGVSDLEGELTLLYTSAGSEEPSAIILSVEQADST